ncbi:MAG: hypothetical protein JOZ32_17215 [Bryobacterales bacterium]|nr:hypothetical protein [Bryobacterales bacterium]
MKLFRGMILGATLLTFAAVAPAQFGPANGRYQPSAVSALVDRVHEDLNHGYSAWNLSHGDRDRLTHAEHQLREFAKQWRRAKFDKGDLDDSIAAVQHVLDNNHLHGAERDALSADVQELRDMREAYDRHEIGYR